MLELFNISLFTALLLVMAHFWGDYTLQSDFIAKNKKPNKLIPWGYVLLSHALTHGSLVMLATFLITLNPLFSMWIGIGETVAHFLIDWSKNNEKIDIHTDMVLHLSCKLVWGLAILKQIGAI